MLYVKFNGENILLDYDNIYCRCPDCGREVSVDLSIFQGDEDFDICETELFCDECSEKYLHESE